MAVALSQPNVSNVDATAPSFWKTDGTALDKLVPGWGENKVGKQSPFYQYQDASFSDSITQHTREFLHACQTSAQKVKEMLNDGIDKHTCNAWGFTGLHFAASKFKLDVAEILIEAGCDVNIQDCNGSTPLDYCYNSGIKGESGSKEYAAMCEFLESKGALRNSEMQWVTAHNQAKYAPNAS